MGSVVAGMGLFAPQHVGPSDQGLKQHPLYRQADAHPLHHQGSPIRLITVSLKDHTPSPIIGRDSFPSPAALKKMSSLFIGNVIQELCDSVCTNSIHGMRKMEAGSS